MLNLIVFSIFIQNKYPRISILYITIIAGYGMIYGINILFCGLPFLPYFILARKHIEEKYLFDKLVDNNDVYIYAFLFILFVGFGIYSNDINYRIAMNKKIKSNQN